MKVIALYESKKERTEFEEQIKAAGHDLTFCVNSNEFLNAINEECDTLLIDAKAWLRGSSIYTHFSIAEKLDATPVVLFNSTDLTPGIEGRTANSGDKVLEAGTPLSEVVAFLTDTTFYGVDQ